MPSIWKNCNGCGCDCLLPSIGHTIHYSQLDQRICKLLLAFHSITGCDSVSSFAGIGKKSALASLKKQLNNLDELEDFGNEPALSLNDDAVVACIRFVCSLYDKSSNDEFNINEVRYKLFTKKSLSGENCHRH